MVTTMMMMEMMTRILLFIRRSVVKDGDSVEVLKLNFKSMNFAAAATRY